MKVIFIQNVAKQGRIGEVKEVADGFAVNVLIPKKQAVIATPAAIKNLEEKKKTKEFKQVLDKNLFLKALNDLQNILNTESAGVLEIAGHKADKSGHLFSQIRESDIVDAIFKKIKISFNPDQIVLGKDPIKKLGEYEIEIKDPTSQNASSGHSKNNTRKIKIVVQ